MQNELGRILGSFLRSKPKRTDHSAPYRKAFKKLAEAHGFTFEKTKDGYMEIAPCTVFPQGLNTPHYDWGETLKRVQACLDDPSLITPDGYYAE